MPYSVPGLPPQEAQRFAAQRSDARQNLLRGRAQNQHQRTQQGIQFNTQQRDLNTDWDRQRRQLPHDYAQQGLLNSGIYHQGLQDYAQDRQQAYRGLSQDYQQSIGNLLMQGRELQDSHTRTVAQSRAEEQARRAQIASELRKVL